VTADSGNTRDDTKTYYTWGAQMELGTVATSYIPTLGSTVTRAQDSLALLTSSLPWSDAEGSLYLDIKPHFTDRFGWMWYQVDTGDSDNYRVVQQGTSWELFNIDGGGTNANVGFGSPSGGTRAQLTTAWKTNLIAASLNGAASSDDTTCAVATSFDRIDLGHGGGSNVWSGYYYRLVWVPRQIEEDADTVEAWRYNF
jgi:hypothetical protein